MVLMNRRLNYLTIRLLVLAGALLIASPTYPSEGYLFNRIVIWAERGHPPPRFYQDNEIRRYVLLLPDPLPVSKSAKVGAVRYILSGRAFLPAEVVQVSRERPSDPGWVKRRPQTALDLNRDGRMERIQGRTVEVPDPKRPLETTSRVLLELREGERTFFGDLLAGPDGGPVSLHSVSAFDFTGEGYPDIIARLESGDRAGIAFYSQSVLHLPGVPKQVIAGFPEHAFRSDRYGIFDLNRNPEEFLAELPDTATPETPACNNRRGLGDPYARNLCHFHLEPPYLGWVESFSIDYEPSHRILGFELRFPVGEKSLGGPEALDILTPVLGSRYRLTSETAGEERQQVWIWKGSGTEARLVVTGESDEEPAARAVSLSLKRD